MTLAPPSSAPSAGAPGAVSPGAMSPGGAAHPAGSAAPSALDAGLAPLLLPLDLRFSPEQFALICKANPEAVLELAADGQLIAMTPTGGDTSMRNTRLLTRMQTWAERQGAFVVFDSSGGFRLPDGSVLSPDAAVVGLERWQALTPEQRRGFPPLCPELVIELASPSDEGPRGETALRRKMAAYLANGALLGWLLFPERRAVEIWRAPSPQPDPAASPAFPSTGVDLVLLEPADVLEGGEAFPGLRLELAEIWAV
ncbi:MAG: Uma2 family endonuclease [Synechococcaceae cyanobacterium]|nr:Uma2 family endonuclease [Synechococcaceae cyanobacterium]